MDPQGILKIITAFFDAIRRLLIAFGVKIDPPAADEATTGE